MACTNFHAPFQTPYMCLSVHSNGIDRGYYYHAYFNDEEMETQKGQVTCIISHSRHVSKLGLEPEPCGSRVYSLHYTVLSKCWVLGLLKQALYYLYLFFVQSGNIRRQISEYNLSIFYCDLPMTLPLSSQSRRIGTPLRGSKALGSMLSKERKSNRLKQKRTAHVSW